MPSAARESATRLKEVEDLLSISQIMVADMDPLGKHKLRVKTCWGPRRATQLRGKDFEQAT